jgi:hypothetical protein
MHQQCDRGTLNGTKHLVHLGMNLQLWSIKVSLYLDELAFLYLFLLWNMQGQLVRSKMLITW